MFPLQIINSTNTHDLKKLLYFMSQQAQAYRDYKAWLYGKCQDRIKSGRYKPLIILSQNLVVGNAVYQFLDENNVEIKNFRIDPQYRNRDLGHFLLKQVLHESNHATLHLDVSTDNFKGVEFFIRNGFKITGQENLYSDDRLEYLMKK